MKWNDLPVEIQEKMLEYQVAQGNKKDPGVFIGNLTHNRIIGGFDWHNSPEGRPFWREVLDHCDFDVFFERYPKTNKYPCVMMVSDDPITSTNPGKKRVVFMEKNGYYLAWNEAQTLKDSKDEYVVITWKYASPINDTPKRSIEDLKEGDTIANGYVEWKCAIAKNGLYFFIAVDDSKSIEFPYTMTELKAKRFELI